MGYTIKFMTITPTVCEESRRIFNNQHMVRVHFACLDELWH